MSNIPTVPSTGQRPIPEDDYSKPKDRADGNAQADIEKEDIEAEEDKDVDRLEAIDAALTENGGP